LIAAPTTTSTLVTGLLVLGVVIALARTVFRLRVDYGPRTAATFGWFALLAALHVVCAATLRNTLLPPWTRISAETLEVRTGGARPSPNASSAGRVVVLPEAPDLAGEERVADLASALRQYPDTRRIRVKGAGLVARDRDAAHSVLVEFHPSPLPAGLVELHAPTQVVRGAAWPVHGRVEGVPGAIVQLLDPAGVAVASEKTGAGGKFALFANPRAIGPAEYFLRVVHQARSLAPDVTIPVVVARGDGLRVLLLAAAPGPELKYLRRWARDAGLDVRSEISLGAANRLTPATSNDRGQRFTGVDLVVLDDRTWRALGVAGNRELLDAARAGTGILLRITGPLGASDRGKLGLWGFTSRPSPTLAASTAKGSAAAVASALTLRMPSPSVSAPDAQILRDPRHGSVLGVYRNEGDGRLGLWWASDSYRLVLRGDAVAHGAIWSRVFAELARPHSSHSTPRLDQALVRVGERRFVCDIGEGALVRAPNGHEFALLRNATPMPDGETVRVGKSRSAFATGNCAAFWPRVPGWHEVHTNAGAWPFHVRSRLEAPQLFAQLDREATLQLSARTAPAVRASGTTRSQPRWPWFLVWLTASAVLWWLERASIPVARR